MRARLRPRREGSVVCPHHAGVELSLFDRRWDCVRDKLVSLRTEAGVTQRGLAKALDCPRSLVSRIELGQRRVDLLEFLRICEALGADAELQAAALMRQMIDFAD